MGNSAILDRSTAWTASFTGVIAAAATPMREDLSVDYDRVPAYVDFLLSEGADALMVGGTTGEFVALETGERAELVRVFARATDGRVPLVAHVGHVDLRVSTHLAEQAVAAGVEALAGILPYFHHATQDAIRVRLSQLARVAGTLPFLVYHYPAATGNHLDPDTFQQLLDEPNIAGIKLSVASWSELQPFLGQEPAVLPISGNDSLMDEFVGAGGRAIVSGNAAALPDVVLAAWTGLVARPGDSRAKALIDSMVSLTRGGSVDMLKEILALRGMHIGPARVLTHPQTDSELRTIEAEIESLCAAARPDGSTPLPGQPRPNLDS